MKNESYQPNEEEQHLATRYLSSQQTIDTVNRLLDITSLTSQELEVLKKSDIHFDNGSETSFSGVIDGISYEMIGSGNGKVSGERIPLDEEKSLFDQYEGIASIISRSQEAKHEPWKTEDNSPTPPSFN